MHTNNQCISEVTVAATRMLNILQEHYLSAIIVQDQAFFDRIDPGEVVT
jgi:ATP-binding cassette subfamily B (MDR/TAP) protein 1